VELIKAYSPRHSFQSSSLSLEEKRDSPKQEEESDSEEQAKGIDSRTSSVSQPQRVALFPGMDPSALKVRLLGFGIRGRRLVCLNYDTVGFIEYSLV